MRKVHMNLVSLSHGKVGGDLSELILYSTIYLLGQDFSQGMITQKLPSPSCYLSLFLFPVSLVWLENGKPG